MHEAEDVCKRFVPLYAFFKKDAYPNFGVLVQNGRPAGEAGRRSTYWRIGGDVTIIRETVH